ncbi:MAG: hypothetical protein AAGI14_05385 [Pseudomonadota bacterium]
MHWSLFAFAGVALIGAHVLRLPVAGGRIGAIGAFLGGLLLAVFAVKGIAAVSDIGRTTDFDKMVNAAVAEARQDDRPLIVFTGASYSRNALDPERLTIALNEAGYGYRAINLSIEAASVIERDAHLQQFMEQSGRVPEIVFVEVAQAFDYRVAFIFGNSKFNARAIEQFDLRTSAWTGLGLAGGACGTKTDCIKDTGFLGLHAALNFFNVGLIGRGERAEDAGTLQSYDAQFEPRRESDPALAAEILPVKEMPVPQWIRSYRGILRDALIERGVRTVGYYQPPVLAPEQRMYAQSLCEFELAGQACLHPNDPDLLEPLNRPLWLDPGHLLDDGAEIYTRWLADELIESGVLVGPQAGAVVSAEAAQ